MPDDPTFAWRVALGGGVLVALAVRDRLRTGTADRFRELGFLLAVTLATMAYAVVHDAITWRIAPEYFAVGKGLGGARHAFAPVAELAVRAGWTAGLAVGLVLLVANNPSPKTVQLGYRALTRYAAAVWLASAGTAVLLSVIGLAVAPRFERALSEAGVSSTRAYVGVQAAHLGSYAGGAVACVVAAVRIRRRRAASTR